MKGREKEVIVLTGAGSIGLAVVRRIGVRKHIVVADVYLKNAEEVARILYNSGFESSAFFVDISSKESILSLIKKSQEFGEITRFVNAAGVSPSQASIEDILKVDLYGTALLLHEFGKVIKEGGSGVIISSQSGYRLGVISQEQSDLMATTPVEKLLKLEFLKTDKIKDTLHAYQLSKRCNSLRVMAEAVKWGKKRARINSISPGIIITPLANDELNGPNKEVYRKMLKLCPAGRAGTPDEVAAVAELLMSDSGAFISGSDFLMDGGVTASYWYGDLSPRNSK
ncbi:SDR family oxidoreductase [Clostridium felsineum]|uniref:SDR family oxidoreductase n=1 Tax=Clostridium felsineum TaxID=36839 RepID=UPI00214D67BC|nr:SDR family oxidoreductase [Clostridium felsineum]MCR3759907.1 SDR family oxidoreductase [Clostridium felsineum]